MPPRSGKTLEKSSCQCPYSTCQSRRARGFFFSSLPFLLSCAVSTAVASPWSSRCSSARRICLTSARGSTRSCVSVASMIERLNDACLTPPAFLHPSDGLLANIRYSREPGLTLSLPEWQPSGLSFGLVATFGDSLWLSRFSLANLQRTTDVAPYWPTKDAGPTPIKASSVLQLVSTVDLIQTSKQSPIRTQRSSDAGSHTGIVPAWTNGKDL